MSRFKRHVPKLALALLILFIALLAARSDVRDAVNPFDTPDKAKAPEKKKKGVVADNGKNSPSEQPSPPPGGRDPQPVVPPTPAPVQTPAPQGNRPTVSANTPDLPVQVQVCTPLAAINCP